MDGDFNQQNNFQQQFNNVTDEKFTKWLVAGILQLMCCNQITGILTIVMAILGNSDFKANRIADSNQKYNIAKIATIIGVIIGALIYLAVFAIYGLAFIASLAG